MRAKDSKWGNACRTMYIQGATPAESRSFFRASMVPCLSGVGSTLHCRAEGQTETCLVSHQAASLSHFATNSCQSLRQCRLNFKSFHRVLILPQPWPPCSGQ